MNLLVDFSHLLFVVLWGMSGIVGLLALISPTALETVSTYGNRIVFHGVKVRVDNYWFDIDKLVFAHSRMFGVLVLAATGYLALISRHGPEAYSKSTLLAIVAVALMMGIIALRHIVRQSLEIDSRSAEAHADPLTGLANRRAFEMEIHERLDQRKRRGAPLCLLIMDVDNFKGFNDTFGHAFGDAILQEIGGVLRATARRDDFIARWGGDELALLLVSNNLDEASQVAERLRRAVSETRLDVDGREIRITASIGLAEAQEHDDASSLYGRSDAALYAAKDAGRNCIFRSGGRDRQDLTRYLDDPGAGAGAAVRLPEGSTDRRPTRSS